MIDPVCFEKIARDFGFDFFAWSDGKALSSQGLDNFVGVISKYPIIDHEILEFSTGKCIFAIVDYLSVHVGAYSLHNSFGFLNESCRLGNLHRVRDHLQNKGFRGQDVPGFGQGFARDDGVLDMAMCAGDFNAQPCDSSIQWFTGGIVSPIDQSSTLWLSKSAGPTSRPVENEFSARIARTKNLDPTLTPNREIDYVFSYGWVYGKRGYPVESHIVEPLVKEYTLQEYSDHYAVLTHLLV